MLITIKMQTSNFKKMCTKISHEPQTYSWTDQASGIVSFVRARVPTYQHGPRSCTFVRYTNAKKLITFFSPHCRLGMPKSFITGFKSSSVSGPPQIVCGPSPLVGGHVPCSPYIFDYYGTVKIDRSSEWAPGGHRPLCTAQYIAMPPDQSQCCCSGPELLTRDKGHASTSRFCDS
jgi:hypothetical protein